MLKVRGLKKNYGDFCLDVSLEVKKGYITGLIGRNGAGKSTLFKGIMGLIRPDSGDIEVFADGPLYNEVQKKQRIGAIFADSGFSQYFNIKEIASLMESMYPTFDKKSFVERCKAWELPLNKSIKKFSSGMLAKLKIIAVTSYDAKLLILDEPTAGLDVVARSDMADMIRDYMMDGERAVLISSHILSDLEKACDYITFIHAGRSVFSEEKDALLEKYVLAKGSESEIAALDSSRVVGVRRGQFGCEALIERGAAGRLLTERAGIEDIMLYYIRGDAK